MSKEASQNTGARLADEDIRFQAWVDQTGTWLQLTKQVLFPEDENRLKPSKFFELGYDLGRYNTLLDIAEVLNVVRPNGCAFPRLNTDVDPVKLEQGTKMLRALVFRALGSALGLTTVEITTPLTTGEVTEHYAEDDREPPPPDSNIDAPPLNLPGMVGVQFGDVLHETYQLATQSAGDESAEMREVFGDADHLEPRNDAYAPSPNRRLKALQWFAECMTQHKFPDDSEYNTLMMVNEALMQIGFQPRPSFEEITTSQLEQLCKGFAGNDLKPFKLLEEAKKKL